MNSDDASAYSTSSAYAGAVPLGTRLSYSMGASAETVINLAFNSFNFFYTNVMGLSGTLAGLAVLTVTLRSAMTLFHVPHLALGAELSAS